MQDAPGYDPFGFYDNTPNYDLIGLGMAWDWLRQFWNGAAQQGWADMQAIQAQVYG